MTPEQRSAVNRINGRKGGLKGGKTQGALNKKYKLGFLAPGYVRTYCGNNGTHEQRVAAGRAGNRAGKREGGRKSGAIAVASGQFAEARRIGMLKMFMKKSAWG
jgi:hypothetical protein